ncbi:acetyltransferase [Haloimpatiens sp. FM7330]|uniref:acetyltransferase n=1 Tax=Haloimpatiens sp. FM7330 TaxID=3298610 RepID=UPI003629462E
MRENKKEKIIIIGDGEFAEIAYEYFTYDSPYEVAAFAVEKKYLKKDSLFGLPVIEFENMEEQFSPSQYKAFTAITFTQFNRVRTRLYHAAKSKGYKFVSYVSSRAFIWRNVEIGENSFIFEDNTLQYYVKVGNNVVMWSGNHVGHRSVINDNCFITSHVVIPGYCEIGKNSFLGVNCTLVDTISIGKDCLIAAGAVVTKNTKDRQILKGNPAKPDNKDTFEYFRLEE